MVTDQKVLLDHKLILEQKMELDHKSVVVPFQMMVMDQKVLLDHQLILEQKKEMDKAIQILQSTGLAIQLWLQKRPQKMLLNVKMIQIQMIQQWIQRQVPQYLSVPSSEQKDKRLFQIKRPNTGLISGLLSQMINLELKTEKKQN